MPDRTALFDRVKGIAGDRFTVDLLDVVTLAKIATTDTDPEIARKLTEFAEKYPGATTSRDDFLTGLEADARQVNRHGLGKLGLG